MCFIDPNWATSQSEEVSRRRFLGTGLVAGVTAAAADWGKALLLPGLAEGAETPARSGGPGTSGGDFKWFGPDPGGGPFWKKKILIEPRFRRISTRLFA